MREAKELFYDKDFLNKLDNNPNLLGFNNWIYDIEKSIFRPPAFDDYVTMSCGYDIHPIFPGMKYIYMYRLHM